MITHRSKYALKALMFLAAPEREGSVMADAIAEANNIPRSFLQTILSDMSKLGFIRSKRGPRGGFVLSRPAQDIAVREVLRKLDGPIFPLACVDPNAVNCCPDCRSLQACRVRLGMLRVNEAAMAALDGMTVGDMALMGSDPAAAEVTV